MLSIRGTGLEALDRKGQPGWLKGDGRIGGPTPAYSPPRSSDVERRDGLRVFPATRSRDAEEQLNRPKLMRVTLAREQRGDLGPGPVPAPLSADVAR